MNPKQTQVLEFMKRNAVENFSGSAELKKSKIMELDSGTILVQFEVGHPGDEGKFTEIYRKVITARITKRGAIKLVK